MSQNKRGWRKIGKNLMQTWLRFSAIAPTSNMFFFFWGGGVLQENLVQCPSFIAPKGKSWKFNPYQATAVSGGRNIKSSWTRQSSTLKDAFTWKVDDERSDPTWDIIQFGVTRMPSREVTLVVTLTVRDSCTIIFSILPAIIFSKTVRWCSIGLPSAVWQGLSTNQLEMK